MDEKKLNVYFIDIYEDSVSGFTTYKEEFLQCVLDLGYYLHCIILNAPVKDFNIFEENDIEYIKIPNACRRESIGCLLSLYIKDSTTNIFIHNFSVAYPVLEMLKKDFPLSKLVFIIHDFIWASYVNGDIARFKKIIRGEIGRDFGYAFYTTDIKEQAERWAVRRAKLLSRKIKAPVPAIVNVYEWSPTGSLNEKQFEGATMEWLEMVVHCRSDSSYSHGYDVVIGKIANDNVGETVSYVMQGIMRKEDAVERLKFEKINNQIAFCTEAALQELAFVKSYATEVK